jgi:hypothetical protein
MASLFAFFLSLVVFCFYAAGAAQEFTDRTQFFLLRIQGVLGLFLALVSLYGIGYKVYLMSGKKGRALPDLAVYLFFTVFGILLSVSASFIRALAGGTG